MPLQVFQAPSGTTCKGSASNKLTALHLKTTNEPCLSQAATGIYVLMRAMMLPNRASLVVQTDKACKFKIKSNLTAATPGSVTFMPNEESPSSTVFIRVYVFDGKRAYGYAQVPGFFQVSILSTVA